MENEEKREFLIIYDNGYHREVEKNDPRITVEGYEQIILPENINQEENDIHELF